MLYVFRAEKKENRADVKLFLKSPKLSSIYYSESFRVLILRNVLLFLGVKIDKS